MNERLRALEEREHSETGEQHTRADSVYSLTEGHAPGSATAAAASAATAAGAGAPPDAQAAAAADAAGAAAPGGAAQQQAGGAAAAGGAPPAAGGRPVVAPGRTLSNADLALALVALETRVQARRYFLLPLPTSLPCTSSVGCIFFTTPSQPRSSSRQTPPQELADDWGLGILAARAGASDGGTKKTLVQLVEAVSALEARVQALADDWGLGILATQSAAQDMPRTRRTVAELSEAVSAMEKRVQGLADDWGLGILAARAQPAPESPAIAELGDRTAELKRAIGIELQAMQDRLRALEEGRGGGGGGGIGGGGSFAQSRSADDMSQSSADVGGGKAEEQPSPDGAAAPAGQNGSAAIPETVRERTHHNPQHLPFHNLN